MFLKVLISSAFLLLALQCHVAKSEVHLDCDMDTTPAACKEQFKIEFGKILQAGLIKKLVKETEFAMEYVKEIPTLSKEEADYVISLMKDLIEHTKKSTSPKELDQFKNPPDFNVKYPHIKEKMKNYSELDQSGESKYFEMKRAVFKEFALEVAGSTLELIDKLRPQDVAEFDELPYYKDQFEEAKRDPDHCNRIFWIALARYLGIPLNE